MLPLARSARLCSSCVVNARVPESGWRCAARPDAGRAVSAPQVQEPAYLPAPDESRFHRLAFRWMPCERFAPCMDVDDFQVRRREHPLIIALALVVRTNHKQLLHARLCRLADRRECIAKRIVSQRFLQIGDRAQASPRLLFSSPEIMCTGMCRVAGSCFSRSRIVHPAISGKPISSVIAPGLNSRASEIALLPRSATRAFSPWSCARSTRMRAKVMSSSTISSTASPGLNHVPIVVQHQILHQFAGCRAERRGSCPRSRLGVSRFLQHDRRDPQRLALGHLHRCQIGLRQIQRKCTAHARRALQTYLSTQQSRQFAADRKPQSCAAVLAAGGSIGLLERFENDSLLVGSDCLCPYP